MFTVSRQAMDAFEANARRSIRMRFCQWWYARSALLGQPAPDILFAGYDRHLPEAEFAGLDPEEGEDEVFLFIAGRMLIPNCEGAAYEALLNLAVDDDIGEPHRSETVARWAGRRS